jgi:hypothetical protein
MISVKEYEANLVKFQTKVFFMELPPEVNSPACLSTAFTSTDPKSTKRQSSNQCLFVHFGSAFVKAAHKMMMQLRPTVNFINIYARKDVRTKKARKKVDEIETCRQFHQRYWCEFFIRTLFSLVT